MIRVKDLKIPVNDDDLYKYLASKCDLKKEFINKVEIIKKSIDARDKNNIFFVYDLSIDYLKKSKYPLYEKEDFTLNFSGTKVLEKNISIIGAGPAGLFCAYMLSLNGYKVDLFERGKKVEDRKKDVENFWENNKLNINSNVQFGEGGAGTFSDGKLNTMVKDPLHIGKKVLEIFTENGASKDILHVNKPHLGTDKLFEIVQNMRNKILKNGGNIYYNSRLSDLNIVDGKIRGFIINDNTYHETDNLVLAIGNSARDTFKMLHDNNIVMESKGFAIGIRIMHDQKLINENQYGKYAKYLENADYKLTYKARNGRGVYSFCMCPGGYIVNSSSIKGQISINGMSYSKRDSGVANSALVVTVNPEDFDNNYLKAINFQNNIEKITYEIGGGFIPIQRLKDYLESNNYDGKLGELKIKGKYEYANINDIFPIFVNNSLKEAIENFNHKIKGFAADNVLIAAVESRTSSPIRIIRDENFETNIKGLFAIGEGAGYAGGITTSSIDGIKMAKYFISEYKNNN